MTKMTWLWIILTIINVAMFGFTVYRDMRGNKTAYLMCQSFYHLPCDKNGELRTDLTDYQINVWLTQYTQENSPLRDDEVNYLRLLQEQRIGFN